MANKFDNNQWTEALSELQSNCWSAWSDAFAGGIPADGAAVWSQAADGWKQLMSADLMNGDAGDEALDSMLNQGRAFLKMTEDVLKTGASSMDTDALLGNLGQGWHEALGAGEGLAALWGMPQDTLRRTMSAFSAMPGDSLGQYKHEGVTRMLDPLREQVERVLSVPPLGYTRESQEEQQRVAREVLEYQAAMQKYMAILAGASRSAIDLLQDKLGDASEPGRGIDSMRGLYDLWVDASEEAYAEAALGQEFQQAYGEMVNSMMRLKKHAQEAVEHQLGAMGIPGRQELNSAHKTIHDLRREVSALRKAVAELSDRVDGGKPAQSSATGSTKRKVAAKRVVAKKASSKKVTAKKAATKKAQAGRKPASAAARTTVARTGRGKKAVSKKVTSKKATGKKGTAKK